MLQGSENRMKIYEIDPHGGYRFAVVRHKSQTGFFFVQNEFPMWKSGLKLACFRGLRLPPHATQGVPEITSHYPYLASSLSAVFGIMQVAVQPHFSSAEAAMARWRAHSRKASTSSARVVESGTVECKEEFLIPSTS
jgi:hypothetical protein